MAVPAMPHPITGDKLPTTLGHEFSGTVEEVGAGVAGLKVGDRVAVKPHLFDGTCSRCTRGRFNSCENLGFIGYSSKSKITFIYPAVIVLTDSHRPGRRTLGPYSRGQHQNGSTTRLHPS